MDFKTRTLLYELKQEGISEVAIQKVEDFLYSYLSDVKDLLREKEEEIETLEAAAEYEEYECDGCYRWEMKLDNLEDRHEELKTKHQQTEQAFETLRDRVNSFICEIQKGVLTVVES